MNREERRFIKEQKLINDLQQENKQLNYFLKEEKEISSREHKAFQRYFDKCEILQQKLSSIEEKVSSQVNCYYKNPQELANKVKAILKGSNNEMDN